MKRAALFGRNGVFAGSLGMSPKSPRARRPTPRQASEDGPRFAQNGSDMLWETDAEASVHLLTAVAPRSPDGSTRGTGWSPRRRSAVRWQAHIADHEAHRPFANLSTTIAAPKAAPAVPVSGNPIFDESGRVLDYRGTGTDRQAQREAEARRAKPARSSSASSRPANEGHVDDRSRREHFVRQSAHGQMSVTRTGRARRKPRRRYVRRFSRRRSRKHLRERTGRKVDRFEGPFAQGRPRSAL